MSDMDVREIMIKELRKRDPMVPIEPADLYTTLNKHHVPEYASRRAALALVEEHRMEFTSDHKFAIVGL